MMKQLTQYMKRILLCMVFTCAVLVAGAESPKQMVDVTPNDWEYQALQLLHKHGAITDMMGIELDGRTYTRYQLTPLIADVVERRESMNDNDRNTALRLYRDYMDEIRVYTAEQTKAEKARKNSDKLEKREMTQEEINKKMESFAIDDSRVKVNGDVRIRFDKKDDKEKTDGRVRTEMTVNL